MEAMACRCAVVTTNVGTEDYLVPGETALVVPPRDAEAIADAILTLLDDRRRLQAVAEAGHRHIRTFTWERAVLGFERALDRKSTRLNSSHITISYAVFCLKKKKQQKPAH